MLRRVAHALHRPVTNLLLRTVRSDVWDRHAFQVPIKAYGAGSSREFEWYFQGNSSIPFEGIDGMKDWLLQCDYVPDPVHFSRRDFWQHPVMFEHRRQGDCEDFSLWAWRKLVEAGFQAEFVAGWSIRPGETECGHTWVHLHCEGTVFVFDGVIREAGVMMRPLRDAAGEYIPQVSVDQGFQRYVYGGYRVRTHC